jgi:hypothetical protein
MRDFKRLGLTECHTLWKYMELTGHFYKDIAILELYEKGGLSQERYKNDCPFCEYFGDDEESCSDCLWPGTGKTRCLGKGSFMQWCTATGSHYFERDFNLSVTDCAAKMRELIESIAAKEGIEL